jgi:hypothetical protein
MRALLSHGLRTLVKRGDRGALEVLGFTTDAEVEVVQFECEPSMISIGGAVELTAHLRSTGRREQRVVVDLVVHFVKASGATSPKVFKWRTLDLGPEEEVRLNRRQSFRDLSTRTHRPGMHRFVLQVAGEAAAETACEVVA